VNYVVKRAPTNAEQKIRNVSLSYGQGKNGLVAADLGGRFGDTSEFGYRFNVAHEELNSYIRDTKGQRDLVALAMDWRMKPGTVIDFELEQSRREQIGVNGYSLLGGVLPAPVDPRVNLTRQPWSLPGVFNATTGSVRLRQELDAGWRWTTQYGAQRLKTDDRLVFGFGCGASNNFSRFCADGSFDLYDFRSNNERRLSDALESEIAGQFHMGGIKHALTASILRQRQFDRLPPNQSYAAMANPGSVFSPFSSPPNPDFSTVNSNRSEYATELSVKDQIEISSKTSVWLGLRHVMFNRSSERNDVANPNMMRFVGHMNVPWVGVSTKLSNAMMYASHGHGVENFVVPNNTAVYWGNAGQQLGVGRSRQSEVGLRNLTNQTPVQWQASLFQIQRPLAYDDLNGNRLLDGNQTHQGIELGANLTQQQWKFGANTQWLQASISDVMRNPALVGTTPLNVPKFILRGMTEYRYSSVPGLRTGLRVSHEGQRHVTEDGAVQLPAWTTLAAAAHYDTKVNNVASTWTLGIDNLADKRYWRESPKQFGHYYLYPGAPRTFRAAVQFRL
jgi:iron complex outermembrane receptor protein